MADPWTPEEKLAWINRHNLETIVSQAVTKAAEAKTEEPLRFIADFLTSLIEEPDTSVATPPLSGNRKVKLDALFNQWDVNGTGSLPVTQFQSNYAQVQMGPKETKVFAHLIDMDTNGDGQIDQGEWDEWFGATCAQLTDADFDVMFQDLQSVATVTIALQRAQEASASPATLYDEDGNEIKPQASLSPERTQKVKTLFTTWDEGKAGHIALADFQKLGLKLGPITLPFFSMLGEMDANRDGVVTEEEMLAYFGMTCSPLSDAEFEQVVGDMTDTALKALAIARAAEAATDTQPLETEEPVDMPVADLSDQRKTRLEELFDAWDVDKKGYIDLDRLQKTTINVGASEVKVCAQFSQMDADNDKKVTKQEVFDYFKMVSVFLDDKEFAVVVDEMTTKATVANLMAHLAVPDVVM